ncbi:MAG: hypothetical protein SNG69_03455 [Rikenellaceae bacterium]
MQIEYIDNNHKFFSDVKQLGRKNAATLGFMPEGGFDDHARKRCIIIAYDDSGLCGYLMYRVVCADAGRGCSCSTSCAVD